jgi:sulfide:quinone oxidoreductase
MDARRVTDAITVSPQISVADIAEIKAAGYRSIVCNRPDGESADQIAFSEIEAAAKAAGLEIAWQPIISGAVSDEDGARFGEILAALPSPTFAYCRSGTRCIMLWSLSEAKARPTDEIIRMAAETGYDLRGFAPRLDAIKSGDA